MTTSATEVHEARAQRVAVTEDTLTVDLLDGRTISAPLAWYPRLLHGTRAERNRCRLIGDGEGIHWPDLDEDLSVENLLLGRASGESQTSFERWLQARRRRKSTRRSPKLDRNQERADECVTRALEAEGKLQPLSKPGPFKPFKPIKMRGKPLSRIIIEERR